MPDALYTFTRTSLFSRTGVVVTDAVVAPVATPVVVVTVATLESSPESSRICRPTIPRITANPTTIAPRAPPEAPGDRGGRSRRGAVTAYPGPPDGPRDVRGG